MTDEYQQPNHVAKTVAYLRRFFTDVAFEEPSDSSYDPKKLLLIVEDAGGHQRDRAFFDLRVTVEARAGTRTVAFRAAAKAEALIREWSKADSYVHYLSQVSNVQYFPVDDHDIPAYRFTSQLAFRGEPLTL